VSLKVHLISQNKTLVKDKEVCRMDHNSTESCSLNLKVDSSISVSITQCYQTIWLLNKKKLFLEKSSHFDTSICEFSIEQKVIHYCSLKSDQGLIQTAALIFSYTASPEIKVKSLWLDHYCSDYCVTSMLYVWIQFFKPQLMECVAFYILKQLRRKKTHHGRFPGCQCQDSSGSNCERMVGREHE